MADDNMTNYNDGATGTHYDEGTMYGEDRMADMPKTKFGAFRQNVMTVFTFKPQSQEYLYKSLFEDSDHATELG